MNLNFLKYPKFLLKTSIPLNNIAADRLFNKDLFRYSFVMNRVDPLPLPGGGISVVFRYLSPGGTSIAPGVDMRELQGGMSPPDIPWIQQWLECRSNNAILTKGSVLNFKIVYNT